MFKRAFLFLFISFSVLANEGIPRSIGALIANDDLVEIDVKSDQIKLLRIGKIPNMCQTEEFYNLDVYTDCTFFKISSNLVATAGHCIGRNIEEAKSFCQNHKIVFGLKSDLVLKKDEQGDLIINREQVIACDELAYFSPYHEFDTAILKVSNAEHIPSLEIERKDPRVSDKVFKYGHSRGVLQKYSSGEVVNKVITYPVASSELNIFMHTNLNVFSGDSGSPLFSEEGKIIGHLSGAILGHSDTYLRKRDLMDTHFCEEDKRYLDGDIGYSTYVKSNTALLGAKNFLENRDLVERFILKPNRVDLNSLLAIDENLNFISQKGHLIDLVNKAKDFDRIRAEVIQITQKRRTILNQLKTRFIPPEVETDLSVDIDSLSRPNRRRLLERALTEGRIQEVLLEYDGETELFYLLSELYRTKDNLELFKEIVKSRPHLILRGVLGFGFTPIDEIHLYIDKKPMLLTLNEEEKMDYYEHLLAIIEGLKYLKENTSHIEELKRLARDNGHPDYVSATSLDWSIFWIYQDFIKIYGINDLE